MTTEFLKGLRRDMNAQIEFWGVTVDVERNEGTTGTTGRRVDNWQPVTTEKMWIQPATLKYEDRLEQGLVEATTHVAYQKRQVEDTDDFGVALREGDRVTPDEETEYYDVLGVHEQPSHFRVMLRKVRRA